MQRSFLAGVKSNAVFFLTEKQRRLYNVVDFVISITLPSSPA